MKMTYLFVIATIVALSECCAVAFFPSQVVLPLKELVGVANWQCALCLGIWTRILPTTSLVLGSSLGANRVVLFLVTHAAGCLVRFLSLVVASIV
jgi:hypothetical protein